MDSPTGVLLLGLILGMRHATEPDHVVAVTTIVSQQRNVRAAAVVGAMWGIGHTLTILVVGGAIILFSIAIPARLGLSMEFAVAVMLVLLGGANLLGEAKHIEEATHEHTPAMPSTGSSWRHARSLAIGVIHGLAGSAAVALLVLATVRDPRWALMYLLLFGVGTIIGMMLLTTMMAVPFAFTATRFAEAHRGIVRLTSFVSIGLGLFVAYQLGVVEGLFSSAPHWVPN